MLLSIDDTFKIWRPMMIRGLGRDLAEDACDLMRPVIEKAIEAERSGRIKFMMPTILSSNTQADMSRGIFNLEIVYHPVVDGVYEKRSVRWKASILKEDLQDAGTAQETKGQAVQG